MSGPTKKKFVIKKKTQLDKTKESIKKCDAKIRDPSFDDRLELKNWVLNDKRIFPSFIDEFNDKVMDKRESIKKWKNGEKIEIKPFSQQKLVSDYMSDNSPYRGLLLYHGGRVRQKWCKYNDCRRI